jgi:23S rRNA (guanosine2251-2'-O)-methyltransferase
MAPRSFEYRVCQNPECGLRYPNPRGNKAGLRCPICLSSTSVAEKHEAGRETDANAGRDVAGPEIEALLDNVRSALNVGSIFRTAEGYAIRHLYLGGITPTPENTQVKKTALEAEQGVPWSAHKNGVELIASLKQDGHCIWVLERTAQSVPIEELAAQAGQGSKTVLVVGNEQAGVDPGILELADEVVHLEMRGRKQSFNVAVAFGIAAQVLTRQNK